MIADEQTDLEDWLAVTAGEPSRTRPGPDPAVAIRRAVELIEIVIDADVDEQLCIVGGVRVPDPRRPARRDAGAGGGR